MPTARHSRLRATLQVHSFSIALGAYLLASLLLLRGFAYRLNPDALSYVSLARRFLEGDWHHGINACWGPLYSVLASPLMALNLDPLIALRLVSVLSGIGVFFAVRSLLSLAHVSSWSRAVAYASAVPLVLWMSFAALTPDLLLAALLCAAVSTMRFSGSWRRCMAVGVLGGMAFLAKSVALPTLLLFAIGMVVVERIQGVQLSRSMPRAVLTMCVLCIIAAPWIMLISAREGHVTIGTAGAFIHASEGPDARGLPIEYIGLVEPAYEGAYSVWEEPTIMPVQTWSPFDSRAAFVHQLRLLFDHVFALIRTMTLFSPIAWALVLALVAFAIQTNAADAGVARRILWWCVALSAPYLPILIDPRYFWPAAVMLVVAGGMAMDRLRLHLPQGAAIVFGLGIIASFAVTPVEQLAIGYGDGERFARQMQEAKQEYDWRDMRIASDVWKNGLYASYWLQGSFLGVPHADAPLAMQLLSHDVDLYLTWGDAPASLPGYARMDQGVITHATVWKRVR